MAVSQSSTKTAEEGEEKMFCKTTTTKVYCNSVHNHSTRISKQMNTSKKEQKVQYKIFLEKICFSNF